MSKKEIEARLKDILQNTINYKVNNNDNNLLDEVKTYDLLYIVDPIEKTFGIKIADVVIGTDYTIMSVNNLANKIAELINV